MANLHDFGTFATIADAWKKYPNGGGVGDYITVNSIRLDWNDVTRSWGGIEVVEGQFDGEVIDHPVMFTEDTVNLGDIKVGAYLQWNEGAMIYQSGDAELRDVSVDSLSIQTNDGYITLADYIENLKADSKHDWEHINNLPIPPDTLKIVIYDTANNLKYYTTIGQLKDLFKTDIPEAVTLTLITSTDVSAEPNDTMPFSSLRTMNEISQITGSFQNHITDTGKHITTTERNWLALAKDWFTEERLGEAPNQTRIIRANFDFYSVRGVSAYGVGELAEGGGTGGAGYLYELGDLALSNVQDDDVLMFDTSIIPNGKWTNKPFPTFSQYLTQTTGDARYSLLGHPHTKAQITDFAHSHAKAEITDFTHAHSISDILTLQDALNAKLSTSTFNTHNSNTTIHITAAERDDWNSKLATSIFTAHAANQTTNVKHLTDAQLSSLTALASYWKLDNDGNLYTERNLYSTLSVSAYGLGSTGGSGGVGSLVTWGITTTNYAELTVEGDGKNVSLSGHKHEIADINSLTSALAGLQDALNSKLSSASYTAADVLTKLITVDGESSGLDADTVDGKHVTTSGWYDKIALIAADGVMEVGAHIDFHEVGTGGPDYAGRLSSYSGSPLWSGNAMYHSGNSNRTDVNWAAATLTAQTDILTPFNTWSYNGWAYPTDKNSLKKFLNLFDIDTAGNLVVKTNLYSTGEVTAYSTGTGVSGLTLQGDMNANGKNINNLTSISKLDSRIRFLNYSMAFDVDGYEDQLVIANDGIYANTNIEASSFFASGVVQAPEFKFGNWTFKEVSGNMVIYYNDVAKATIQSSRTNSNL